MSLSLRMTISRAFHGAGIVHGLISHAGRHGTVPDHADYVMRLAVEIASHRHPQAGGNRCRRMGGAEAVVFALRPLGEAGQAAALAKGANLIPPSGQDLVGIGLVSYVPD